MTRIALVGAAGLSGLELIRLIQRHPQAELEVITSGKYAGKRLADCFPQFVGMPQTFTNHDVDLKDCDVVFLAVPNKASLDMVPRLLQEGRKVIDLSGVYRLHDTAAFKKFYKLEHTSPDVLKTAVFGLPEYFKPQIQEANLIGNPGCYPTGSLLGLLPFGDLLGLLDRPPIIDAKSGVTGAGGRVEDDTTNYVTVNENFKAYKVFVHQHQPEIQQYLSDLSPYSKMQIGEVIFTPHLLPLDRGILSTIYLHFSEALDTQAVRSRFEAADQASPFVHLLPEGTLPDVKEVQHSNRCHISVNGDESGQNWIVITAIDNLTKGAAGQALQNMNLMFGHDETAGLI